MTTTLIPSFRSMRSRMYLVLILALALGSRMAGEQCANAVEMDAATRNAIDALGFQPQRVGHAFPEDRPMRVGAIEHEAHIYRLHVHIIADNSEEVSELRRFRDALRADPELRDAYEAKKRDILQAGLSEPVGYTKAKGDFINAVLAKQR